MNRAIIKDLINITAEEAVPIISDKTLMAELKIIPLQIAQPIVNITIDVVAE